MLGIRARLGWFQAAPIETITEEAPQAGKLPFVEVMGSRAFGVYKSTPSPKISEWERGLVHCMRHPETAEVEEADLGQAAQMVEMSLASACGNTSSFHEILWRGSEAAGTPSSPTPNS